MEENQGLPPAGPKSIGSIAATKAGIYTDIVSIYGPAEAEYGETVNIEVVIQNLTDIPIYIAATGRYDGVDLLLSPEYDVVEPGASYSFTASFTMPNHDITLDIWSYYWTGSEWVQDDHEAVSIKLKTLAPQFSGFGISDYSKA